MVNCPPPQKKKTKWRGMEVAATHSSGRASLEKSDRASRSFRVKPRFSFFAVFRVHPILGSVQWRWKAPKSAAKRRFGRGLLELHQPGGLGRVPGQGGEGPGELPAPGPIGAWVPAAFFRAGSVFGGLKGLRSGGAGAGKRKKHADRPLLNHPPLPPQPKTLGGWWGEGGE